MYGHDAIFTQVPVDETETHEKPTTTFFFLIRQDGIIIKANLYYLVITRKNGNKRTKNREKNREKKGGVN